MCKIDLSNFKDVFYWLLKLSLCDALLMEQASEDFILDPKCLHFYFQMKSPETLSEHLELGAVIEPKVQVYEWACDQMEAMTKK